MRISVNGETRETSPALTVDELVGELAEGPRQVAVAVNGDVVPRAEWAQRRLADGDRVEIVAAIQGGTAAPASATTGRAPWTTR